MKRQRLSNGLAPKSALLDEDDEGTISHRSSETSGPKVKRQRLNNGCTAKSAVLDKDDEGTGNHRVSAGSRAKWQQLGNGWTAKPSVLDEEDELTGNHRVCATAGEWIVQPVAEDRAGGCDMLPSSVLATAEGWTVTILEPRSVQKHVASSKRCFLCEGDHYAKKCPIIQSSSAVCVLCGDSSHQAKKCHKFKEAIRSQGSQAPTQQFQSSTAPACQPSAKSKTPNSQPDSPQEGQAGHTDRESLQLPAAQRVCFQCGDTGHLRKNCPHANLLASLTACFHCGEQGHVREKCPRSAETIAWKACYHCGEKGHEIKACPNASEKISWKERTCPRCEKVGHSPWQCRMFVDVKVFHKLVRQRKSLPIAQYRDRLLATIQAHSTILLAGETGSGKSTQLPQYLMEQNLNGDLCIGITQPRRVAAITIAERVAREKKVELGDLVGYSVRFRNQTSEKTKIKYLTDGTLLREAISDPLLSQYAVIILDEAHERTLHTDVLFAVVKKAQACRKQRKGSPLKVKLPPLKIVVMSATINTQLLSEYFNNAPWFFVEGRQYPIAEKQANAPVGDYLKACMQRFFAMHRELPANEDILMFLTGKEEILKVSLSIHATTVRYLKSNEVPRIRICHFHAQMTDEQKKMVFEAAPQGTRKLILATNIAETSLTISGVRHIIDCGMVKTKLYDAETDLERLCVVPESQAQARQRCGRAGREAPGSCWRMLTATEFQQLPKHTLPEIKRTRLSSAVLQLLAMGVKDILHFDFIEPPDEMALKRALEELQHLGAVDKNHELTEDGKKMSAFPLEPRLSKAILAADKYGCRDMMLTAAAVLSVDFILLMPAEKKDDYRAEHARFKDRHSDVVSYVNIYKAFRNESSREEFCKDNFLDYRQLVNACAVRKQLQSICQQQNLSTTSHRQDSDKLRRALVDGFFLNAAKYHPDTGYVTMIGKMPVAPHPSTLCGRKHDFVLFNSLLHTSKCFMRGLTHIEPEWLYEAAPDLFPHCARPSNPL